MQAVGVRLRRAGRNGSTAVTASPRSDGSDGNGELGFPSLRGSQGPAENGGERKESCPPGWRHSCVSSKWHGDHLDQLERDRMPSLAEWKLDEITHGKFPGSDGYR